MTDWFQLYLLSEIRVMNTTKILALNYSRVTLRPLRTFHS